MIINARLNRKDYRIDTQSCVVDKVIELGGEGFELFKNNLLQDYPFIESHKDLMGFDDNGKAHCILVIGEDTDDGILIESECSSYARYSAFIPNARQILMQEQMSPTLKDFVETLQDRVNRLVKDILFKCEYDHLTINFDEIQPKLGEYLIDKQLLIELLCERDEIEHIETDVNDIIVYPKKEYLEDESDSDYDVISLDESCNDDIELKCAKHILWIYGEASGEQADFENHRIDNIDFDGKSLNSVKFANGKFNNCSFKDASLCFASAENAVFRNCDFSSATSEESEYINCRFINCRFNNAAFAHSNFTGATFLNCHFERTSFEKSLTAEMKFLNSLGEEETNMLPDLYGSSDDAEEWESGLGKGVVQE